MAHNLLAKNIFSKTQLILVKVYLNNLKLYKNNMIIFDHKPFFQEEFFLILSYNQIFFSHIHFFNNSHEHKNLIRKVA